MSKLGQMAVSRSPLRLRTNQLLRPRCSRNRFLCKGTVWWVRIVSLSGGSMSWKPLQGNPSLRMPGHPLPPALGLAAENTPRISGWFQSRHRGGHARVTPVYRDGPQQNPKALPVPVPALAMLEPVPLSRFRGVGAGAPKPFPTCWPNCI